jgi:hypothetical protein
MSPVAAIKSIAIEIGTSGLLDPPVVAPILLVGGGVITTGRVVAVGLGVGDATGDGDGDGTTDGDGDGDGTTDGDGLADGLGDGLADELGDGLGDGLGAATTVTGAVCPDATMTRGLSPVAPAWFV